MEPIVDNFSLIFGTPTPDNPAWIMGILNNTNPQKGFQEEAVLRHAVEKGRVSLRQVKDIFFRLHQGIRDNRGTALPWPSTWSDGLMTVDRYCRLRLSPDQAAKLLGIWGLVRVPTPAEEEERILAEIEASGPAPDALGPVGDATTHDVLAGQATE